MTQKQLENRLTAIEIQRVPILEKTVEKMHTNLFEMYEDWQRQTRAREKGK